MIKQPNLFALNTNTILTIPFFRSFKNCKSMIVWRDLHNWVKSFRRFFLVKCFFRNIFTPHCYFTRLNHRKKGTFYLSLTALVGVHRNLKHPSPLRKIAKMAVFNSCMEFEIFLGQMSSFDVL